MAAEVKLLDVTSIYPATCRQLWIIYMHVQTILKFSPDLPGGACLCEAEGRFMNGDGLSFQMASFTTRPVLAFHHYRPAACIITNTYIIILGIHSNKFTKCTATVYVMNAYRSKPCIKRLIGGTFGYIQIYA